MKKAFISQPMRGKTDIEILEEREKIIMHLREEFDEEYEVIDSFLNANKPALEMLGLSIQLLSMADIAVFAKGWEKARGCKIEHECAKQYGIKILD